MKYSFTVSRAENAGDIVWVAESKELKNCLGVGETQEEALAELEENERVWLEMAEENGFPIPEIHVEKALSYSGKMTLRISPKEHERAAKQAEHYGISLNQYINDAVVAYSREPIGNANDVHEINLKVSGIAENVSSNNLVQMRYAPKSFESSYSFELPNSTGKPKRQTNMEAK